MPKRRRHRRSVSLVELEDLGPYVIRPQQNLDALEDMARGQAAFGGGMRARILPERVDGTRVLTVMVLYTSTRARVATLDPKIAKKMSRKVRWLWLIQRVVSCEAAVDADPNSPNYLDITLNPGTPTLPVRDLSSRAN
ncbi:hypothetical protein [Subtercola lobariae]|uniref:Uncharacterized protein n=1 Tax=Subtercola lobariae TaxID=1588641 RepID=A0A917EUA3_9MICO|nr:hypothetical protein [Subtercola lobariae]GGF13033.1 hypothetical protein GCM10011399_03670 [Subtercola lobariae]